MKKLHQMASLIDVYGNLITKKEHECLTLFYFQDLSLLEIATLKNTKRAAIYNNITRATKKLVNFEKQLKIIEKKLQRNQLYEKINDQKLKNELLKLEEE